MTAALLWLTGMIAAALGAAVALFRPGGKYNPPTPESDVLDPVEPPETAPVAPLPVEVPVSPAPVPAEPITPPKPKVTLAQFCTALRDFEGGPGDANYKNHNPGNVRCSPDGYLPKYGMVRCSPAGFAVFSSYELGWEYLLAIVSQRAALHPNWTVYDFFANYAPSQDKNDPKHYAEVVSKQCGVSPTTTLRALFA